MKATKIAVQKPEPSVKKTVSTTVTKSKPNFAKSFAKAAADVAAGKPPKTAPDAARKPASTARSGAAAKKSKNTKYRDLIDPSKQDERKKKYLESFERLKDMSLEDMQVRTIVNLDVYVVLDRI
jgi:hypothetical protein